jgi:carbamoyltransferase
MSILGFSVLHREGAACPVRDGEVIAAQQEKRFTRKKHDSSFPSNVTDRCLEEGGLEVVWRPPGSARRSSRIDESSS